MNAITRGSLRTAMMSLVVMLSLALLSSITNAQAPQGNLFTVPPSYPAGTNVYSVMLADFNEDGKPDAAVTSSSGVSILLANGDGTFQQAVQYATGSNPTAVAVAEFNGDGHLDLVVANNNSGGISVLFGKGDGTFQAAANYATGSVPRGVAVGDFNGDGKPDIVVVHYNDTHLSVLLNNGNGTFQPAVNYPRSAFDSSVVVADVNGDGKLDLVVGNNGSPTGLSVLLGNGNGTFQSPVNFGPTAVWSLTLADLNGDGRLDIVVATQNNNTVNILLGNGDGTFQTGATYTVAGASFASVGDLNGDGKPDLVVPSSAPGGVAILMGKGDGTFQAPVNYVGGNNTAAIADLNGDGKLDFVAIGANMGATGIAVFLGKGDGTFPAPVNYTPDLSPKSVTVGDFNGDGKLDFATVNYNSNNVSVFLGNGDGTFPAPVTYPTGLSPQSVAANDINGDGILDLVVANGGDNTVSILISNGDGTFKPAVSYATGASPSSVAVGDFNGDGIPDLAVSGYGGGLSILLGNGDGTFQPAMNSSSDGYFYTVVAGDFNNDGKLDLALSNDDGVYVFLGNGDGTFQSPVLHPVGQDPYSLVVADVNSDGKLDLVAGNYGAGGVSVLLGNGDGTFQAAVDYAVGSWPYAVAVSDFNGDGKPDVVMAVVGGNLNLLLGNGDGTFQAATSYPGIGAYRVAVGDLRDSGVPDLVVGGVGASVYLNAHSPVSSFSTRSLTFGSQAVGTTSASQTVTLTNTGSAPFNPASISTTPDFSVSGSCTSVPVEGTCTLSVAFNPVAPLSRQGSLTVGENSFIGHQTVALSGTGIGPIGSLGTRTLSFPTEIVGTESGAQAVTLTNAGNASLQIASVNATGDFGETSTCASSLDVGASCTINVTFTPTMAGSRSGTLNIADNNDGRAGSTQTVSLAGTGTAAPANVSPASLTFNSQIFGTTSAPQTVTLTNTGSSPLTIASVAVTANFSQTGTCSGSIAGNGACTINVTFTPTAGGTTTGTITITSNASNSPNVITLTGTGLAPRVGVYLLTLYFPDQLVGVTSASEPVKVTNIGSLPLIFSSISTTGDFAQTNTCAGAVAPLASCTVNVTFTPSVLGAESGTVMFTDNAPGSSPVVNLSGSGTNTYSAPWIAQIVPPEAVAGGPAFTLTVNGTGFGPASVVNWNGSPRATTMVNGGQLTAAIKASDIATGGTSLVTVVNPSPAGASPSPAGFDVLNPIPSLQFSKTDLPVGQGPEYMAMGDFNGDGKVDLVVPNNADGTVSVLLGNGDGTFQSQVTYATGYSPYAIVTGDFNHDGKPDLAVTNLGCLPSGNCYPGSASVSILLGNGDGTFGQATAINTNSLVTSLATADFNGDGRLDLVVGASGNSGGDIVIYLGNGDGTFQAGATYPVGGSGVPGSIVVADYNGDGKLDLAVANGYSSNGVSILLGNGDGTFQSAVQYATGLSPQSIATADFNGDGKLDLVVANGDPTANSVSILLGNGDGTFRPHTDYSTGVGPASVTTGDFNGDGKLDLATADSDSNTVSILLGNGDGTFQANQDFVVGATPVSVVARDFNGDGRLDLAVTNWGSNTVSVLLQTLAGVSLSSTSVSFGNQAIGAASSAQSVTLGNTGSGILNISSIAFTGQNGGDFGQTNNCGTSVASGAKCAIAVRFTPKAVGAETGTLTITDNAAGSPHTVALTGTGVGPASALSPASLTFPAQMDNTPSAAQVVTLANSGNVALAITSVAASGDFAETNTCGASLAAGANCAINVTFTPTAGGARSGTLAVTDNSSGVAGSTQSVSLSGTGQDFSFAPPSGSPTSASVSPGSPAAYTLSVGGEGGMSGQVTFTCAGAPSEATCTVSPNPVTAGSSAANVTVTVTTTAASVSAPSSRPSPPPPLTPGLRGLLMLALALAGMVCAIVRRNQPVLSRWPSAMLMLAAALLLTLALIGCGGGGGGGGGTTSNPGTPAGTYTLTVTGTTGTGSSALSHSVTLKLTVS
jgi:hypothetical protein